MMMMMWSWLIWTASAQEVSGGATPDLNGQLYHPPVDGDRYLWADSSMVGPDGFQDVRVMAHYTMDPVVYLDLQGQPTALVSDIFQANILGSYRYKRVRVGVDIPTYLRVASEVEDGQTGLGDIALDIKGMPLPAGRLPVGIALAGRVGLPTTTIIGPLGSRGLSWEVEAIVDKTFGPVSVAMNLGTRGVPRQDLENVVWDDQLTARLSGAYNVIDQAGVSVDLGMNSAWSALSADAARPAEAIVGGWYTVMNQLTVRGGVGSALTGGIGAGRLRVLAGVTYTPNFSGPPDTPMPGVLSTPAEDKTTPPVPIEWDTPDDAAPVITPAPAPPSEDPNAPSRIEPAPGNPADSQSMGTMQEGTQDPQPTDTTSPIETTEPPEATKPPEATEPTDEANPDEAEPTEAPRGDEPEGEAEDGEEVVAPPGVVPKSIFSN